MGMIGYFFRADDELLEKIKNGSTGIVFQKDMEEQLLDIDKSWHAIHFIVTGHKYGCEEGDVLGSLIFGDTPVNEEDLGYGPAMVVGKDKVAQIAKALEPWDKDTFHAKFHIEDLLKNDIYPVMEKDEDERFFTYIWENFVCLKEFYQQAAKDGQYILTFIG